ncbi:protein artemis-like [Glandiceps talaboti]
MSTFGGRTVEYPDISIDRFDGDNLRAKAYFLSHAHADHMQGLNSQRLQDRLQSNLHIKLYCSEVTKGLLVSDLRYTFLKTHIEDLPNDTVVTIDVWDGMSTKRDQVFVTSIPSGHCPGSVMFLFEGSRGTILYTGDFRFAKEEVRRIPALHCGTRVKDIQSLYLDTTFCHPNATYLPSREECLSHLITLVDGWICRSPHHMVRLVCKAKYGYEYLFVELSQRFNCKVHVSDIHYSYYSKVKNVSHHLTTDGNATRIHACRWKDCKMDNSDDVLCIQPSTMWFLCSGNATPRDVIKMDSYKYRLCYSFHSSYSEIRDFADHICPVNIYANVIPKNSSEEEVMDRLKDLLRGAKKQSKVNTTTEPRLLGKLKTKKDIWRKRKCGKKVDGFANLFGEGDDDDDVGGSGDDVSIPSKISRSDNLERVGVVTSSDARTDAMDKDIVNKQLQSQTSDSYHGDSQGYTTDSTDSESELDLFSSQESCCLTNSQGLSQSSNKSDTTFCDVLSTSSDALEDLEIVEQIDSTNQNVSDSDPNVTSCQELEAESESENSCDSTKLYVEATPGTKKPSKDQLQYLQMKFAKGDGVESTQPTQKKIQF